MALTMRSTRCPNECYKGGVIQLPLSNVETATISESAKATTAATGEDARRCAKCGLVYVALTPARIVRLGFLNGDKTGPGWFSKWHP